MTVRPELPPALVGFRAGFHASRYALSGVTAGRIHPYLRVRSYGDVITRLACASASRSPATAPPEAESIGRPRHYGRDPFSFSHTTGPTRPVPRTRAEHDVTTVSRRCRAPLLRFSSPSAFAGHARVLNCPEAPSSWTIPASTFRHLRPALLDLTDLPA